MIRHVEFSEATTGELVRRYLKDILSPEEIDKVVAAAAGRHLRVIPRGSESDNGIHLWANIKNYNSEGQEDHAGCDEPPVNDSYPCPPRCGRPTAIPSLQ